MLSRELEDYLFHYLNVGSIKDYCPNGLQIEGKKEVTKIATAVSANLKTLQKAVDERVDALIVHHGLFWEKDPYPIIGTKREKIELLLRHQIALLAYHLPLDAHREVGNNWKAALDLGWEELEPFGDLYGTYIGVRGSFTPQPIEQFVKDVEEYYGHAAVVALGGKRIVSNGALISGGAYKELGNAALAGADCFITGNYDEPAWSIAHEEKIHFLALGHSATEKAGPMALADHLKEKFGIDTLFIDIPNPF